MDPADQQAVRLAELQGMVAGIQASVLRMERVTDTSDTERRQLSSELSRTISGLERQLLELKSEHERLRNDLHHHRDIPKKVAEHEKWVTLTKAASENTTTQKLPARLRELEDFKHGLEQQAVLAKALPALFGIVAALLVNMGVGFISLGDPASPPPTTISVPVPVPALGGLVPTPE